MSKSKIDFGVMNANIGHVPVRLVEKFDVKFRGEDYSVPAGFETDGASIPRFLWRICGHPMEAPRLYLAIIHDWFYSGGCPGVTRSKQWVPVDRTLELLDTPGILWPKFDDRITGENLAFTGAIRDAILDTEELASSLCERLYTVAPDLFCTRYKLDKALLCDLTPYEKLCAVAGVIYDPALFTA